MSIDYKEYFMEKFSIAEIVPRGVYDELGEAAWHLFDSNLLHGAGWLREKLGPAVCNNWHLVGSRKYQNHWRGLRTDSAPSGIYSPTSQHTVAKGKKCAALDLTFLDFASAEEVREEIRRLDNTIGVPFITRIEDDVNWIHIDTKPMKGHDKVYFFKP